jgi:hypothetical protein
MAQAVLSCCICAQMMLQLTGVNAMNGKSNRHQLVARPFYKCGSISAMREPPPNIRPSSNQRRR